VSWVDDALAAVRIAAAIIPVAAPANQLHAEIEARNLKARLEKLEDPISGLHSDVPDVASILYEAARANRGRPSSLDPGPEFFERYAKVLALLEGHGLVAGTRSLGGQFLEGVRPAAAFVVYMATRYEEPARITAAVALVENAARGTWLDGRTIGDEIGVPWMLMAALFDIYEAKGLGIRSKETGTVRYLSKA
jgi:hypothetical protein